MAARMEFYIFARRAIVPRNRAPTFSIGCFSDPRSNCVQRVTPVFIAPLALKQTHLTAWLTQDGIRCRKHRFIVVIRQSSEEMVNSAERLAQKQTGSTVVQGRRVSISLRKLKLGIIATEHARCSKKVHRGICNAFLEELHIQYRLTVSNERAVYSNIKPPDQTAKLIGEPTQLGAAYWNLGHPHGCAQSMLASCPSFREAPLTRGLDHRVVDFLELHARSTHPHQRDKRSEYFVSTFTDLIDTRVAHHSLKRKIDKVRRAAINLKHVIDALPKPLGCKHF